VRLEKAQAWKELDQSIGLLLKWCGAEEGTLSPPFEKGRPGGISGNPFQNAELSRNPSSINDEDMAI
jgi:hypothetical protein